MARTSPRHQRPTRAAPLQQAASPAAASASDRTEPVALDMLAFTRRMFGASLDTSQQLMRGLCELQQAQAAALHSATERIGDAAGRAAEAPDWGSLFALQANLATTQWAQSMQDIATQWRQWMDIESRVLERGRADAAGLSQRWMGSGIAPWSPLPDTDSETAADSDAPLALLGQAQAAWGEMLRVWTEGANFAALRE
jgi:Phasin protein